MIETASCKQVSRNELTPGGTVAAISAIKSSGIAVYNVLASFANSKTQSCFPTHKTIAKIAGTSKRTVSEKIRLLDEMKLIRRQRQEGQSIYHLLECRQVKKERPEVQQSHFEGEKSGHE